MNQLAAMASALMLMSCQNAANPQLAADGTAFLSKNASEPGVKTLPDGLQYKVVRSGPAGGRTPGPRDEVKVHYEGKLITGQIFDSSYQRGTPAAFPLQGLIPAWVEALQMMRPGDEWMLYVPAKLGYGDAGAGGAIPPGAVLIFRIELLDVLPAEVRVGR